MPDNLPPEFDRLIAKIDQSLAESARRLDIAMAALEKMGRHTQELMVSSNRLVVATGHLLVSSESLVEFIPKLEEVIAAQRQTNTELSEMNSMILSWRAAGAELKDGADEQNIAETESEEKQDDSAG